MNCSVFHPGDSQIPTGSKVVKICINIFSTYFYFCACLYVHLMCALPVLGPEKDSGSPGTGVRAVVGRVMCVLAC